jgi:hypothetical protein
LFLLGLGITVAPQILRTPSPHLFRPFAMAPDIPRKLDVSSLQAENIQLRNLANILTEENQRLQRHITVFPLTKLPKELRMSIWTAIVSDPRVIRIRKTSRRLHFSCSSPPPITLHICRESRDNTLKLFKVFYISSDTIPRPVYFRPDVDTFFFDMKTGLLEFVWQHQEVKEVHTIAMAKSALYDITSPTLLLDIRRLALFERLKFLVVTGRMTEPSHCCPKLYLARRSVKNSDIESWQDRIRSCSGSEVQLQSAKVICSCTARFKDTTGRALHLTEECRAR